MILLFHLLPGSRTFNAVESSRRSGDMMGAGKLFKRWICKSLIISLLSLMFLIPKMTFLSSAFFSISNKLTRESLYLRRASLKISLIFYM